MKYESPKSSHIETMASLMFLKGRSRSRSLSQNLEYAVKGLVTRNTHMKYEINTSSLLEAMSKVKVC